MRIEVTEDDIATGSLFSWGCPIAKAISRAMQGEEALVRGTCVDLEYAYEPVSLPRAARKFVRDYDAGKPVKPFSFELPGVEPCPVTH